MDLRYLLIGVLWFAMMLGPMARAQNEPINGLTPRGAPQSTDIMPILAAGAPRMQYVTVGQLVGGAIGGSVTSVTCGAGLSGGTITTTGACALADIAAQTHKFIASVTAGVPTLSQPAFSDLSGSAACAQLPALTGDATSSAGSCGTTLATVNSNTGSCGDSTHVCQETLDAKGRVLAASAVAITGSAAIGTGGTLYVNASTGSDSNACTSSGAACLTIGHALSLIPPFVTGNYTVNIADGTYAECLNIAHLTAPADITALIINGNTTTPANVLLTGQCTFGAIGVQTAGLTISAKVNVVVQGVKIAPTAASQYGAIAFAGTSVALVGDTIAGTLTYGAGSFQGGLISFDNTTSISGWSNYGLFAGLHGMFGHAGGTGTLTLSMTPAVGAGVSCIHSENNAQVDLEGTGTITCPGGSAHVTFFFDGDTNATIFSTMPSTVVN
ncbi:MAG TPA: hypothetical protein VGH15_09655, partial [Caulobacteraceae bacterium]